MKTDWIAGLLGPWSAELTLGSIFLRLAVSMALAAIIGCERSSKRHSAGLRTFILVSLAGTATMLIDLAFAVCQAWHVVESVVDAPDVCVPPAMECFTKERQPQSLEAAIPHWKMH